MVRRSDGKTFTSLRASAAKAALKMASGTNRPNDTTKRSECEFSSPEVPYSQNNAQSMKNGLAVASRPLSARLSG